MSRILITSASSVIAKALAINLGQKVHILGLAARRLGAFVTCIPILIERHFQSSTLTIGLLFSTMFVTVALSSYQFSKSTKFFAEKTLIKASFLTKLALL